MHEDKSKDNYKSILVIVTGFLILELIFESKYLGYTAVGVGFFCLLSHRISNAVVFIWYKIAEILGWINARIILTTLYFIFLTPLSLIYKLFNKNPLQLKKMGSDTGYVVRNKIYKSEDFENMW